MPRRSLLTVPLAVHSKSQRRRSADARLTGSTRTPGLSWDDPIALSSDEDDNEDQNDDTTRTRPKSGVLPLSRQPTTPVRPRIPNVPATDPGPLRTEQEASDIRAKSYQQRVMPPCGKQYAYPMGKRSREHRVNCEKCRILDDQVREAHEKEREQLERADKSPTSRKSGDSDNNNPRPHDSNDEEKGKQSQHLESQRRDQVASMIHHRLIQDAKERLTKKEKKGYLYILRSPQKPGLLKLGCCSRDVSKRGKEHTCVEGLTWVEAGKFVNQMMRAEKLVKRDLDHLRRDWKCSKCSKTHTEWFEVDEETAKEVMKRWTEWINKQAPYELNKQTPNDEHWRLKPMWAWLMDERRAPRASFGDDDHQARWTHWEKLLSPPSSETERAWIKYSENAGLETPNQQQDREKLYLPYRQPTLKDQRDVVTRQSQNFLERLHKVISVRQSGGTNNLTINCELNVYQCPPDSRGKVTELK